MKIVKLSHVREPEYTHPALDAIRTIGEQADAVQRSVPDLKPRLFRVLANGMAAAWWARLPGSRLKALDLLKRIAVSGSTLAYDCSGRAETLTRLLLQLDAVTFDDVENPDHRTIIRTARRRQVAVINEALVAADALAELGKRVKARLEHMLTSLSVNRESPIHSAATPIIKKDKNNSNTVDGGDMWAASSAVAEEAQTSADEEDVENSPLPAPAKLSREAPRPPASLKAVRPPTLPPRRVPVEAVVSPVVVPGAEAAAADDGDGAAPAGPKPSRRNRRRNKLNAWQNQQQQHPRCAPRNRPAAMPSPFARPQYVSPFSQQYAYPQRPYFGGYSPFGDWFTSGW